MGYKIKQRIPRHIQLNPGYQLMVYDWGKVVWTTSRNTTELRKSMDFQRKWFAIHGRSADN